MSTFEKTQSSREQKLTPNKLRKIETALKTLYWSRTGKELKSSIGQSLGQYFKYQVFKLDEKGSEYIHIHFNQYKEDVPDEFKQFRGVILKDYSKVVANGFSYTPTLNVSTHLRRRESTYTETLSGSVGTLSVNHTIDIKQFAIRPSLPGSTIIMIWKQEGKIVHSSYRKPNISKSVWPKINQCPLIESEDTMTFEDKFASLMQIPDEHLFDGKKRNSPFCHIFLLSTKNNNTPSYIEAGKGFIVYITTKECYKTTEGHEERVSKFLSKIDTRDLLPAEAIGTTYKDRYVVPMASDFKLDPEHTVYSFEETMDLKSANAFLFKGLFQNEDQPLLKHYGTEKLLNGGESLFIHNKVTNETYILQPPAVNYRQVLLGGINTNVKQLLYLRSLAYKKLSSLRQNFTTPVEMSGVSFNDICFPFTAVDEEQYYPTLREDLDNLTFQRDQSSVDIVKIIEHADIIENFGYQGSDDADERWYISTFFYVLANPVSKRCDAVECFNYTRDLLYDTIKYICENRGNFKNPESQICQSKTANHHTNEVSLQEIKRIIKFAEDTRTITVQDHSRDRTRSRKTPVIEQENTAVINDKIKNHVLILDYLSLYKILMMCAKIRADIAEDDSSGEKETE